jgi:hypothetical protein
MTRECECVDAKMFRRQGCLEFGSVAAGGKKARRSPA